MLMLVNPTLLHIEHGHFQVNSHYESRMHRRHGCAHLVHLLVAAADMRAVFNVRASSRKRWLSGARSQCWSSCASSVAHLASRRSACRWQWRSNWPASSICSDCLKLCSRTMSAICTNQKQTESLWVELGFCSSICLSSCLFAQSQEIRW